MTQLLLQQAMALHQAGRLDEAEKLYQQILAREPRDYPALHLMGLLRLMQGRLPEALKLMEAALKAQPGAPDTLANYGIVLSGLGRQREALTALDSVVKARPVTARPGAIAAPSAASWDGRPRRWRISTAPWRWTPAISTPLTIAA